MATRQLYTMILAVVCAASVGCCGGIGNRCLSGSCGSGCDSCATCGCPDATCGCPDDCCDTATCGCPDDCCDTATCGCPDDCCDSCATCGCPDATCGCPDDCGTTVGCGSSVGGSCRLLQRMRKAFSGCSGCSSEAYWSEWHNNPPCDCNSNNNYTAGAENYRRPSQIARRKINSPRQLAQEDLETTYR
jgi:hypothetical protein